jgi:hypothetical protein
MNSVTTLMTSHNIVNSNSTHRVTVVILVQEVDPYCKLLYGRCKDSGGDAVIPLLRVG